MNGTTMDLSGAGLNAKRLGVVIKQCRLLKKPIQVLQLDRNDLGDDCAPLLIELINTASKALAVIDLSHNCLGAKSISSLLSFIKNNRVVADNLQCLRLDGNREMGGVSGLGSTIGRELKEVYDKGALHRLWCLSLTLDDFKGISGPGPESSGGNRPSTTGATVGKKVGAKTVKAKDPMNAMSFISTLRVKAKPSLVSLELKNARLSQKTVAMLAKTDCLSSLTHLDLRDAQIGPMGVQALSYAIQKHKETIPIISLGLRGNLIGDYGAEVLAKALAGRSAITDLDLTSNNLTDAGAIKLSQTLVPAGLLVSLKLAKNRLTGAAVRRLIGLARSPNSALAVVDLSGQPLPVLLKHALEKELQGRHQAMDGNSNKTRKALTVWKKGYLVRELFRSALMDGYVKVWTFELPHDSFDFSSISQLGPNQHTTHLLEVTWDLCRSGADPDPKNGGSRFLWKLLRDRHGDVVIMRSGRSENHVGVHKSHSAGGATFLRFKVVVPDCMPGDKFILSVAAVDQHDILLPKLSLVDAGEILCRKLKLYAKIDNKYGMLYESTDGDTAAALPDYDEARATTVTNKDENETWKLITLFGDGEYMRLHDIFVGVGGHVRLWWESRVEDREDGALVLPFVWAVMRRSLGVSTIIAHGRVEEAQTPSSTSGSNEGWIPQEVVVNCCVPGDVLVLWLGVLKQKGDSWSHHYTAMIRQVRMFRESLGGGIPGGNQGDIIAAVPFASGYPFTVSKGQWGY